MRGQTACDPPDDVVDGIIAGESRRFFRADIEVAKAVEEVAADLLAELRLYHHLPR